MKVFQITSLALIAAAFAAPVSATPIQTTFNIAAIGVTFTSNTGSVATASSITDTGGEFIVSNVLSDNTGLGIGTLVTLAPSALPVTVGSDFTKTFTTALGTFVEDLTVSSVSVGTGSLAVQAAGTISEITVLSGTALDPTAVYWSSSYTQNAGVGSQINASFNDSTTPPTPVPTVPEPGSLALVGAALAAAAAVVRRRKA